MSNPRFTIEQCLVYIAIFDDSCDDSSRLVKFTPTSFLTNVIALEEEFSGVKYQELLSDSSYDLDVWQRIIAEVAERLGCDTVTRSYGRATVTDPMAWTHGIELDPNDSNYVAILANSKEDAALVMFDYYS